MRRPIINNKNTRSTARLSYPSRRLDSDNNMKKEIVFPLVVGIIFGALVMIFWQFTARLNNQNVRLAQLEQFATQNAQTVNEIIAVINNATAPQGTGTPTTPNPVQ